MLPEAPNIEGFEQKTSSTEERQASDDIDDGALRKHASPLRKIVSVACILVLCALLSLSLSGCGGGFGAPLSISGGGFPIGGSRLFGKAVSAMNTAIAIPNARIQVEATPIHGVTQLYEMQTDSKGSFSLDGVLAGKSGGTIILTATPSDVGFRQQRISFQTTAGRTDQVLMTLPPASLDLGTVKSLTLSVANSAIASGSTVQLNVRLKDANDATINLTPSLLYDGDFGTLNDNGTFTVNQNISSGSGRIAAYWYGFTPQSADIRVDNTAQQQPPDLPATPISKKTDTVGETNNRDG